MTAPEMDAWDTAAQRADQVSNKFCRMKNHGDKAIVAFLGKPHVEELIWVDSLGKNVPFTDEHKAKGLDSKPRFKMNVWNRNEKLVQILTLTAATFKDVIACRKKYGTDTKFYEIERRGAAKSTDTKYVILPDVDISPDEMKMIKNAKLHDLTDGEDDDDTTDMNSHGKAPGGSAPAPVETIDTTTAKQLIDRVKILPKHILDGFLEQVKAFVAPGAMPQIKNIVSSNLPAANRALAECEAKNNAELALKNGASAPTPAPAEIDPFAP